MKKSRIEPLAPPYDEETQALFEKIMPPGVAPLLLFRTVAHNPRMLKKWHLANLLGKGSIDARTRELVILRTCARCGSEYEWGVHVSFFGERVGLTRDEMAMTVGETADSDIWSEQDKALIQLVDVLHERATVEDELWQRLCQHWTTEQLVELVTLVGFYHMVSFMTNVFGIALEEWAERFPIV